MKFFTREESRSFDNFLMSEYSIPGIILMENAGAGAARILLQNYSKKTFYIFCGKGNNGGDGFVIARHLWNAGCSIKIFYIGNPTTINTKSDLYKFSNCTKCNFLYILFKIRTYF